MNDSDKDEYDTAADALHLRRWERRDMDVKVISANNERERTQVISIALAALPPTATNLEIQQAIWDAAAAQAASFAARMMERAVEATTAEWEAAEKVNALVHAIRTKAVTP